MCGTADTAVKAAATATKEVQRIVKENEAREWEKTESGKQGDADGKYSAQSSVLLYLLRSRTTTTPVVLCRNSSFSLTKSSLRRHPAHWALRRAQLGR